MTLRRFSCLLLVALLVLSSCGFSPFKTAFATDTFYPPNLPSWILPNSSYAHIISASGFHSYETWSINDSSSLPGIYDMVELPAGTYMVDCDLETPFSLGQLGYEFSGCFAFFGTDSSKLPSPTAIALRISNSTAEEQWFSFIECDFHFADVLLYFEAFYEGDAPPGTFVDGVFLFFSDPSPSNYTVPADPDYSGIPSSNYLYYSVLRANSVSAPSQEDKFQNGVIGGLDDIENSIDKGFGSIKGEIQSGSQDVVDAVDGVTDAVGDLNSTAQEWGQNIVNGITEGATAIQETITEESEKLGNFILDGLKSLFIPRDGYFKELFDDLNSFFSEVFGFLYFPIEHALSWFNRLLNLPEVAPSIAIPELAYEGEVLIPAQTYTFDFLQDEPFSTVHDYYLMAIDAAMIMSFVHLLQRKYEEVMRN